MHNGVSSKLTITRIVSIIVLYEPKDKEFRFMCMCMCKML